MNLADMNKLKAILDKQYLFWDDMRIVGINYIKEEDENIELEGWRGELSPGIAITLSYAGCMGWLALEGIELDQFHVRQKVPDFLKGE